MNHFIFIVAVVTAVPLLALGAPLNISKCGSGRGEPKTIAVPNDQAALVQPMNGAAVLIRLNTQSHYEATYRWEFLSPAPSASSGEGRVFEDFDRKTLPNGDAILTRRNTDADMRILAGDIAVDWSAKDVSSGWLYYCPALASVQLVDVTQYKKRP